MATDVSIKQGRFRKNYCQLHRSNLRNTLNHAHTISRIFPSSETSLGYPTAALSEAGDFVEYLTEFALLLSGFNLLAPELFFFKF